MTYLFIYFRCKFLQTGKQIQFHWTKISEMKTVIYRRKSAINVFFFFFFVSFCQLVIRVCASTCQSFLISSWSVVFSFSLSFRKARRDRGLKGKDKAEGVEM